MIDTIMQTAVTWSELTRLLVAAGWVVFCMYCLIVIRGFWNSWFAASPVTAALLGWPLLVLGCAFWGIMALGGVAVIINSVYFY